MLFWYPFLVGKISKPFWGFAVFGMGMNYFACMVPTSFPNHHPFFQSHDFTTVQGANRHRDSTGRQSSVAGLEPASVVSPSRASVSHFDRVWLMMQFMSSQPFMSGKNFELAFPSLASCLAWILWGLLNESMGKWLLLIP